MTDLPVSKLLIENWRHDADLLKSLWFDWFCPDDQLPSRALKLMTRVHELVSSPLIDDDCYRVFFKNLRDPLPNGEDQIHLVPIDEASSLPRFTVTPPDSNDGMASCWHPDANGHRVLTIGTWQEILRNVFAVFLLDSQISLTGKAERGKATWLSITKKVAARAFSGIDSNKFSLGEAIPLQVRKRLAGKMLTEWNEILAYYDSGYDPDPELHRSRWLAITRMGVALTCECRRAWTTGTLRKRTLLVEWPEIGWLQFESDEDRRVLKGGSMSGSEYHIGKWIWDAEIEAEPLSERDLRILYHGIRELAEVATGEGFSLGWRRCPAMPGRHRPLNGHANPDAK